MKVIENRMYHTWFHVALKPGVEQHLAALYTYLCEHPGDDRYDIVVTDEKTGYQALMTPQYNTFRYSDQVHEALERLQEPVFVEAMLVEQTPSILFDSPIEQMFWDEWLRRGRHHDVPIIPQYVIGKYRVDFAHPTTKTVIELDGHATHSSPDAIAYDRKRQREIESIGWYVIRFGGKEITEDVSACVSEAWSIIAKKGGSSLDARLKAKNELGRKASTFPKK